MSIQNIDTYMANATPFRRSEADKEIRVIAKNNGLTFKRGNFNINGKAGYMFVNAFSKIVCQGNFWACYENCMSGYIDTLEH